MDETQGQVMYLQGYYATGNDLSCRMQIHSEKKRIFQRLLEFILHTVQFIN